MDSCTSKSYTATMLASDSIAAVRASSKPGTCARECTSGPSPTRSNTEVASPSASSASLKTGSSSQGSGSCCGARCATAFAPGSARARGVHLIQLDAFDGHLALDARVPRHPHGAEAAGFRFADGSIPVQYELSIACHAPIIGQAAADAHASCRNACLAQKP